MKYEKHEAYSALLANFESKIIGAKYKLKRLWDGPSIPDHVDPLCDMEKLVHEIAENEHKIEILNKYCGE